MIEMKLKDVLDSMPVLKQLGERQLRGRVAYNIAKIMKQVENEFNLFNDARQQVIEKYGEKDDNGELKINEETNEYVFTPENLKSVSEELNMLLDQSVSINANKIKVEDLDTLGFTPVEMVAIEGYIEG